MWCSRRFREQVLGELFHQHDDIIELTRLVRLNIGVDMAQTDDLNEINDLLTEAGTEIPARLDELLALVAAGQPVPQELVDSIKAKAASLANIVPNAPAEPEVPAEPETPAEPEAPVEEPTA